VHQKKFLLLVLFVCFQPLSFAQIHGEYALKVDVDSVFLNMSVRDRATNRSLDVSGSTGSYIKMMKQAAIEFTHSLNPVDRVAIATFNSKAKLVEDFTNDRDLAERAIKRMKSGGGTAFYDALMTSINQYMRNVQGRTAIVVFTDGVDNQLEGMPESGSSISFEELYRRVQEIDTVVYTIFLNTEMESRLVGFPGGMPGAPGWPGGRRPGFSSTFPFPFPLPSAGSNPGPPSHPFPTDSGDAVYRQAREQLQLIADQTGGRMYAPNKISELSDAYSEIAGDLRIQYQLGYNSTNQVRDGKWRKIRVKLEKHFDAVVRTRPGYYTRKEDAQQVVTQ